MCIDEREEDCGIMCSICSSWCEIYINSHIKKCKKYIQKKGIKWE